MILNAILYFNDNTDGNIIIQKLASGFPKKNKICNIIHKKLNSWKFIGITVDNLTLEQLKKLANERLADAKALYAAERYDGAFYICGYAVEMGLKYKICKTLDWDEYPTSGKGSDKHKSFKTHKFDDLLHYSGAEKQKNSFFAEWSIVMKWDPEIRYSSSQQTPQNVKLMIEATEIILGKFYE